MIHYVETKESIFVNNTISNILSIDNGENLKMSLEFYLRDRKIVELHVFDIHKDSCCKCIRYIIDTEYDFKIDIETSYIVDSLQQFCSNIRQFKINQLVE